MSVLSILKLENNSYNCPGHCLYEKATKLNENEINSSWIKQLAFDMLETLYFNTSGVGIAANQIGVLKNICVIDLKRDGKKPLVLLNPIYEKLSDEVIVSNEICLSFPNVMASMKRYKKILVSYTDLNGEVCNIEAEGFKSNVFQHEIDHLNGDTLISKYSPNDLVYSTDYSFRIAELAIKNLIGD